MNSKSESIGGGTCARRSVSPMKLPWFSGVAKDSGRMKLQSTACRLTARYARICGAQGDTGTRGPGISRIPRGICKIFSAEELIPDACWLKSTPKATRPYFLEGRARHRFTRLLRSRVLTRTPRDAGGGPVGATFAKYACTRVYTPPLTNRAPS